MTPFSIRILIIILSFLSFVLMLNKVISIEAGIIFFIILLIVYAYIKNLFKNKKASN